MYINSNNDFQAGIEIRPYKFKDLATLYGTTPRTFRKWLRPFKQQLGELNGHYYSITQVKLILSELSSPIYKSVEEALRAKEGKIGLNRVR